MKKYVFDDSTIHTLHSMAKKLYDTFSTADRTIAESDFTWSHNTDVDFAINPYKYYNFRLGPVQIFIHKFKNGFYALECYGFVPEDLKPYDVEKFNIDLYRNLYGRFDSFDSAKLAFADLVSEKVKFHTKPLF